MIKASPSVQKRFAVSAVAFASLMAFMPAQAGFLDDFYAASGTNQNMTAGGVYEGQSSTVVSGGSFNLRIPNRSFTPISLTPPSLNAGCGGIDLYLGAFGFPTGAEMTAFLRNVGQAAGGIAFSVALKALSPELSGTIDGYSKDIQKMMQNFKSSCQAANLMMKDSGANAFIEQSVEGMKKSAKEYLRTISSDETNGTVKEVDPVTMKKESAALATANPNSAKNPETNLVWDALNSGDSGATLTRDEKMYIMGLTGTLIVRFTNSNDSSLPVIQTVAPSAGTIQEHIMNLVGDKATAGTTVDTLRCTHKATEAPSNFPATNGDNCLIVAAETRNIGNGIRYRLEESKVAIINSIRTRTALDVSTTNHYGVINGASSLPLLKMVQAAAQQRNTFITEGALSQYLDVAAMETAIKYLRSAVGVMRRTENFGSASSNEAKTLRDRAVAIDKTLDVVEASINDKLSSLNQTLSMYEEARRYMRASVSPATMRSASFR